MNSRQPMAIDLYTEEIYQIKDRVLIVLSGSWDSISEDDKTLLAKILGAVKLSIDGVQIITQKKLDLSAIHQFTPKWVIQFSSDEPDNSSYYEVEMQKGFSLIKSHALSDLNDARKKSLWQALKSLLTA